MYCPNCGAYIPDEEKICPSCHTDISVNYQNNNTNFNQAYNTNLFNQPNIDDEYENNKNSISNAKLLGILSIVLGILFSPIIGIICGAIGLSTANKINVINSIKLFEKKNKVRKLNIIGIVIPIIIWVLGIISFILFFGIMSGLSY